MDSLDAPASPKLAPEPEPRRPHFWDRWLTWKIILPGVTLLLGIGVGVVASLLYVLSLGGEAQAVVILPSLHNGDIVIQVGPRYITTLVGRNLRSSGMPGEVNDVVVSLRHGDQMVVTGNDEFSVLGIGVVKHFTVTVQPYIRACQLQMHVLRADLSGIPVTGFVARFEGKINQQLRVKPTGLPVGFAYCAVGVRTEPQGLFVTYSATPLEK